MSEHKTDLRKAATYALSCVLGALCAGAALALCGWLMYIFAMPLSFARFLSLLSLGAGCMLAGFVCGVIKRRGGLRCGFICAVILLAACMLISLLRGTLDGGDAIAKTLTCVLTGCAGGVFGVNAKRS